MKSCLSAIAIALLVLAACSNQPNLDKEKAAELIRHQFKFPGSITYEMNTIDPEEADRFVNAGLERDGYIGIRQLPFLDRGIKPMVALTIKAKPYIVRINDKEAVVKAATTDLGTVTSVITEGNKATVAYRVVYKDTTAFSRLITRDFSKPENRQAMFLFTDQDGWQVVK